jgi:hypothetical protein
MADWCLDELRHKATLVPDGSGSAPPLIVYNGDVVKSDNIVPVEFKKSLQDAVNIFQDKIPESLKDWHPRSDEKVWDLVHPSLFPMVYGRTRVLAKQWGDDHLGRLRRTMWAGRNHPGTTRERNL